MTNQNAVKVLTDLIHTSEDGEKGYAEAAELAEDAKLKLLFRDCAADCHNAARELQAQVSLLGGKPEDRGSVVGTAHRGWVKLKSAVSDSNIAVLEEVERGQDYAKAAYLKALKADLPPQVHALVKKQSEGALSNHDRIRDLRNAYRARAA